MPDDKRLYMTFPIDIHRHPKITRLAVEVRWTFVEMNGEARLADNDGVFEASEAEFMWPIAHLAALSTSHPTRPLVVSTGDTYVIRDYSEHQLTREARQRKAGTSRENGQKGGRPKGKPSETQTEPSWVSDGTQTEPDGTQQNLESESESESELKLEIDKTDVTNLDPVSHVSSANDDLTDEEFIAAEASNLGIRNLSRIRRAVGVPALTDATLIDLTRNILDLATKHVRSVEAYMETVGTNTPETIRTELDRLGVAS